MERMARGPRLDGPGVLHHVMARGIEQRPIFRCDSDRRDLLSRLASSCREGGARIFAWALLPNHAHALLLSGKTPLSRIMQRVLGGYAREFNRRYRRHGHLFQNRFKSVVVEHDPYLLELVRYIHLNPLRAGLVADVAALDRYAWSGHSRLMGFADDRWQDVEYVLSLFGDRVAAARRAYRSFVEAGVGQGRRPDLSGGGLCRSRRGCEVVAMLVRGRERWACDERVLGSSDFVAQLQAEELAKRHPLRPPAPVHETLARIVSVVAEHGGLSAVEICSGSKRRDVVRARALLSFMAIREAGLSAAHVARALNVTPRAVVRVLGHGCQIANEAKLHLRQTD
jgi:putative transposase